MPVLLIQWPGNALVEILDGVLCLLRNMSHDRVNHLALVVSLLALDNVFW